jgi:hypothetical protein
MNVYMCNQSTVSASPRMRDVVAATPWLSPARIAARAIGVAKRRRERVLASLAFVMLIVAWDATLRLDERVAPPRMRLSHAVEHEREEQMLGLVP